MREPWRYKPHWDTDLKPDPKRCAASVSEGGRSVRSHQCQFKRKFGEWCGVHDPEKAAEREKSRPPTKFERDMQARHDKEEAEEAKDAEIARLKAELEESKKNAFTEGFYAGWSEGREPHFGWSESEDESLARDLKDFLARTP